MAVYPYNHRARCEALIEEARTISCYLLYFGRICRPPNITTVSQVRQRELVNEWASGFEHELKEPLLACANALTGHEPLPWAEAVAVTDRIGNFDGQRAALSVAYFSGDCDSIEGDAALVAACNRIKKMGRDSSLMDCRFPPIADIQRSAGAEYGVC